MKRTHTHREVACYLEGREPVLGAGKTETGGNSPLFICPPNRSRQRDFLGLDSGFSFSGFLVSSCPVGQSDKSGHLGHSGSFSVQISFARMLKSSVNSGPRAFGMT